MCEEKLLAHAAELLRTAPELTEGPPSDKLTEALFVIEALAGSPGAPNPMAAVVRRVLELATVWDQALAEGPRSGNDEAYQVFRHTTDQLFDAVAPGHDPVRTTPRGVAYRGRAGDTWSFETNIDPDAVQAEDFGTALVAYGLADETCPLYVHLLSEAADPAAPDAHAALRGLLGHTVRITVQDLGVAT